MIELPRALARGSSTSFVGQLEAAHELEQQQAEQRRKDEEYLCLEVLKLLKNLKKI